mgnify:CR=1 FL=1
MHQVNLKHMNMGTGSASIEMVAKSDLFYRILTEETGFEIGGDHHLYRLMIDLAVAKREFDKVSTALQEVRDIG